MYETFCSSCHGPDGKGGAKASSIVDGTFLALLTDQELRTLVIVGRPDLGAPDWRNNVPGKPMSSQEISDVVAWLSAQRPQFPGRPYPTRSETCGRTAMTLPDNLSRRAMLVKLGIFFNGIIAALLAVPILRYVLSPVTRARKVELRKHGFALARSINIPPAQTRLGTFRNPDVAPWDGKTADSACWVRRIDDQHLSGLRHQLRASWLSGALVPAIRPVHVSVPRRRLLRRRLARVGSSRTRPLRIPLQN